MTERPCQVIRISEPFAIARYPTTVGEYAEFCRVNKRIMPIPERKLSSRIPITNVTWDDAVEYCGWLSNNTGAIYRLPSEAEWEYVCRAGTGTSFWWGQDWDPNKANNGPAVSEVGEYPSNEWGVFDMTGNVFEWCADHWIDYLNSDRPQSAHIEHPRSKFRVIRGGSWALRSLSLRAAYRTKNEINGEGDQIGFRVVREI